MAGIEIPGIVEVELLVAGANGSVYRGREADLDRGVAVKVMRATVDGAERRFEREKRAMGRLSSIPGVAPIYRVGTTSDGSPFLVMPLYERSVQALLDAEGPLSWSDASGVMWSITSAIAGAHKAKILHLDIKPSNILLDSQGSAFLADFGIAEFADGDASMSATMMTPQYSAPERFYGEAPSEAADIYSLGATLFALLNGSAPFSTTNSTSPAVAMQRVLNDEPNLASLGTKAPASVVEAIGRAMAKNAQERPASATDFLTLLEGKPSPPPPAPSAVETPSTAPAIDERTVIRGNVHRDGSGVRPQIEVPEPAAYAPTAPPPVPPRSQGLGQLTDEQSTILFGSGEKALPQQNTRKPFKTALIIAVAAAVLIAVAGAAATLIDSQDGTSESATESSTTTTELPATTTTELPATTTTVAPSPTTSLMTQDDWLALPFAPSASFETGLSQGTCFNQIVTDAGLEISISDSCDDPHQFQFVGLLSADQIPEAESPGDACVAVTYEVAIAGWNDAEFDGIVYFFDGLTEGDPVPVGESACFIGRSGYQLWEGTRLELNEGLEVSVFELRAGDCIQGEIGSGEVQQLLKVDCSVPHEFEVYREALIDLSVTSFDEAAISAQAEEVCRTSLAAYIPPDDDRDIGFKWFQPTEESWTEETDPDRVVTCLLFDQDGPLTGRAG